MCVCVYVCVHVHVHVSVYITYYIKLEIKMNLQFSDSIWMWKCCSIDFFKLIRGQITIKLKRELKGKKEMK